ncbi:phosphoglycerate mutase [Lysobacter solisilvae (ex Woo and Kim 2020)]|uniref:Phosphoglycerate mutase n=1 Tax=Agrilutibacter terrestris TaxID=2865112 RepID=A0A7H0FXH9_9GAMM|nr:phosphoglycerate mutase [Lysobacter terrestris]QNP40745.1 phosphoglycerate mutase [Lysobacter terrestris]
MASATLLLPPRERFGGQRLTADVAKALGRADRETVGGEQRARVFDILPRGWPVAAVTRQRDAGDAPLGAWLRADPAYVRPDINGARLLAWGEALALSREETSELLRPLRPLFGDTGFPIDAPTPSRWYLRLPREARLPTFTGPDEALGADLFEHLPDGPEGRRWRSLLSEAQVVLHNHPVNAQRAAAGKPPVNSLWFWGAGVLPDHVTTRCTAILSDDDAFQAFAAMANADSLPLPSQWGMGAGDRLFDLRHVRDLAPLQSQWLEPLLRDLRSGVLESAALDFADGVRFTLRASQRWRFWRRPLRAIAA